MSEPTLATLWGTMYHAGRSPLPTLLRSSRGNRPYVASSATAVTQQSLVRTEEVSPDGEGGECVFKRVHVAVTWTAPVLIRVAALVDGLIGIPFDPTNPANDSAAYFEPTFNSQFGLVRVPGLVAGIGLALPQQNPFESSAAAYVGQARPLSRSFAIPLVVATSSRVENLAGYDRPLEQTRTFLRGHRIAIMLQTVLYGHGVCDLDGVEVEYEVVPRTRQPDALTRLAPIHPVTRPDTV